MFFRSVKYCITVLLIIGILFCSSHVCFADGGFSWEQWLEDEIDYDINNAMTFDEMESVYSDDRYELRINGDNGVFYLVDKKTDVKWRSNPENWEQETKVAGTAKESLNAQLLIKCYSQSERQFINLNSYSHSCAKGGFSYEKTKSGYVATYKFDKYDISVAITVDITDKGLEVSLKKENFSDAEDYRVFEISILPYFLSSSTDDNGYMFIPDGTGAIINLNNNKTETESYSGHIYGDSLNNNRFLNNDSKILLPVYALCKNGSATMAVVEEGDALATVKASVAGQVNSVNAVYTNFTLRDYAFYDAGAYGSTDFDVFEKGKIKQDTYKTVYYFLEAGKNTYYDIANRFKAEYIEKSSNVSFNAVIDVLGATRKIKSFLGVPVTQTEVLTDIKDLDKMLDSLEKSGATGLAVRYNGVASSELKSKVYDSLKIDGKIGNIKSLNSLAENELKRDNKLYISYNPVRFVKGVFSSSKIVSRDLLGQFVTLNKYNPSGVVNENADKTVLLRPSIFLSMTEKIADSVSKKAFGLAPQTVTADVYTDYSSSSGNAQYTVNKYISGLKSLSKNGVMGDKTSFFALPYSEINGNIPISSSNHDLFDSSVPFFEIALSGRIAFSYKSLNSFSDVDSAFLKCVETGALPKYSLYYGSKSLLRDSDSTEWFNGNFDDWNTAVAEQINEYKDFSDKIGDREIISHEQLAEGVFKTVFASGKSVVVNYTEKEFEYGETKISSIDYVIMERDEM